MDDRIREAANDLIDAVEQASDESVRVEGFDIQEYIRGDPTDAEASTTGAEIAIKAYVSLGEIQEDDEDNPYRIK